MRIAEIQAHLSQIRESLEGTNKMCASLFNLILYTSKNGRELYIQELAHKIVQRFPSRVLFLTVDPQAPPGTVKANVSIIPGSKGAFDVVCDYVEFAVSADGISKLPFLLLPHLIPDLPIYVCWGEDPCTPNDLATYLTGLATRMIFDSETTTNLLQFAENMLQRKKENRCEIADLNWARTESWRELFSATFHPAERISQLAAAKTIEISYNSRQTQFCHHPQIQAIYLQAWLYSQLNWSPKSVDFILKQEDRTDLPPGAIIGCSITTQDEGHFSFTRSPSALNQIDLIFSTKERCEIPAKFLFTKTQSGLSLVNEIGHSGTSTHYIHMLEKLREVVA